eukprot:364480-Chlamydomonas_euryale.AAC.7
MMPQLPQLPQSSARTVHKSSRCKPTACGCGAACVRRAATAFWWVLCTSSFYAAAAAAAADAAATGLPACRLSHHQWIWTCMLTHVAPWAAAFCSMHTTSTTATGARTS